MTPNARAGVIVPSGILFGTDKTTLKLRKMLIEDLTLHAVITMPSGVFKPYAGVATSILIFENKPKTKSVWFYEMSADGFSLSDTRTPIEENDIPDILEKWTTREKGAKSFSVSASEIAQNGFSLMSTIYKEPEIIGADHDKPSEIIEDVLKIEKNIEKKLGSLLKRVSK